MLPWRMAAPFRAAEALKDWDQEPIWKEGVQRKGGKDPKLTQTLAHLKMHTRLSSHLNLICHLLKCGDMVQLALLKNIANPLSRLTWWIILSIWLSSLTNKPNCNIVLLTNSLFAILSLLGASASLRELTGQIGGILKVVSGYIILQIPKEIIRCRRSN
jgi:hypothetical protein